MKSLYKYLFIYIFLSCNSVDSEPEASCKIDGIDGAVCIEIYQPVCGCNHNTYSNSCYAEIDGVTSWTDGECAG